MIIFTLQAAIDTVKTLQRSKFSAFLKPNGMQRYSCDPNSVMMEELSLYLKFKTLLSLIAYSNVI